MFCATWLRRAVGCVWPVLTIGFVAIAAEPPVTPASLPVSVFDAWRPDRSPVERLLEAASALQAMPHDQAVIRLREMIAENKGWFFPVELCRMLFEPKPGKILPLPEGISQSFFSAGPNGPSVADWPDTPLAIVDGIPFPIASIGAPSLQTVTLGNQFLDLCLRDGQWTTRRYAPANEVKVTKAFNTLLKSPVWRFPSDRIQAERMTNEIASKLRSQIEVLPDALPPVMINALPDAYIARIGSDGTGFRISAFLELAAALESLPRETALAQLRQWAVEGVSPTERLGTYYSQVSMLCCLLFEPKEGRSLRRGGMPIVGFIGDRDDYEAGRTARFNGNFLFSEEIPFGACAGHALAGRVDPALTYLDYCIANGRWTARHYAPVPPAALEKALDTLLKSPGWKRPLTEGEKRMFAVQIQPVPPLVEISSARALIGSE
jgi:hypothetical protein